METYCDEVDLKVLTSLAPENYNLHIPIRIDLTELWHCTPYFLVCLMMFGSLL